MSAPAMIFSVAALQGISQVGQGYAAKAEAKYNASLYNEKAKMVEVQMGIENAQYRRLAGKTLSKSVSNVAGAGLMLSGSPVAYMVDTQAQIEIDRAIGQYNLQMEKNANTSASNMERARGRNAVYAGWGNAFNTMLSAGANVAMYQGMGMGKKDMSGGRMSQYGNRYGINTPTGTFDMGNYSKIGGRN